MPSSTALQAVSFDVGGTLIDPWPSVGHVYADVAAAHGWMNIDPDLLNRQFSDAWKQKINFDYSKRAWAEVVAKTFHGTDCQEQLDFFEALYDRFTDASAWRVYPDVLPTLTGLQRLNLRLAVISNWDERLTPLLQHLQLHSFFETIVISQTVGAHKPDSKIFRETARRLALPPAAILHVGDSFSEDVAGARASHFQARYLHRGGPTSRPLAIASLQELLLIRFG